ncbi:MAG: HlyD family secretion protein [Spirirestis rafaelensis WJT71-NPBG6]|jgi:HlyD family secretion protein|nr:HlyD family secretion protein [Spirirestis rafaelensis WJT71-NPBG6]
MNIPFEQSVILERPKTSSRMFIWLIISLATSAVTWASLAKIEEAIPATGKLEPQGFVQEVKAPTGGVVREIYVQDGQQVKKGQILLNFDTTAPKAELESLNKVKESLQKENQFYTTEVANSSVIGKPSDLQVLTQVKAKLRTENQAFKALVSGVNLPNIGGELNANQQLVMASRAELQSRQTAGRSQVTELQTQLAQTREQLTSAEKQLPIAQAQLETAKIQLATAEAQLPKAQERAVTAKQILSTDKNILERMTPLASQGAISIVQAQQQRQKVLTRYQEISSSEAEILTRRKEVAASQSEISNRKSEIVHSLGEIARMKKEEQRIDATIAKAQAELQNTVDLTTKEVLTRITENDKKIAEIDSQLSRARLENQKKIDEIDAQISKAKLSLEYQELRAPADGVVFNLQAHSAGFVANSTQPILTVVPNENLVANVFLTNKDIGFVRDGMEASINIESFPESEFGSVTGKLIWVGSDALPPTQERPFYNFPAKIKLESKSLSVNGKKLPLQSGMAVNCSIKVRKRTVLSIFTDMFDKKVKSLETVR